MLSDAPICFGCCLDLQDLARTADFKDDPFRDLFDELAAKTGRSVHELRATCLRHQQELIADQLKRAHGTNEQDALVSLAGRVSAAARQVESQE